VHYLEQDDTEDQEPVTRSEQVDVVLVPELKGLDPDPDLGNVDVVFMVLDICLDDLRGHKLQERNQSAALTFQAGDVDQGTHSEYGNRQSPRDNPPERIVLLGHKTSEAVEPVTVIQQQSSAAC
jgi:hypothetical protein